MPQFIDGPSQIVARASYDNIAESPDELAFRRGDVLTVLEGGSGGGWWLCSLRGRQGLCPANRLQLVRPDEPDGAGTTLQRQGKRRSWHVQPNKVVTPQKFGDVFLYDLPQTRYDYDVPRPPLAAATDQGDSYDVPPPPQPTAAADYDVPRPHVVQAALTPSSSVSSLTSGSASNSNRSSLAVQEYDVPRPPLPPTNTTAQEITQQVYDVPPPNPVPRCLPLDLSAALDLLNQLEGEASAAASRLLALVGPQWRVRANLEPRLADVRTGATRLRAAIHRLSDFTEGALGNAANAPDKGLVVKLRPLVGALRQADATVSQAVGRLEAGGWALEALCPASPTSSPATPDSLDQLVACARALTDDVRRAASFIQGNSTLLFKRGVSPSEWIEDYDTLDGGGDGSFDSIVQDTGKMNINEDGKPDDSLDPSDGQVLSLYLAQCSTHGAHLTRAIDAFLHTVEHNQPPKVFLAQCKCVVLCAHRLVHIGDTVHRCISCADVRAAVLACADSLSRALAATVHKTKRAALQFPSVTAVQEMVDGVVDVSHSARDLRLCLAKHRHMFV